MHFFEGVLVGLIVGFWSAYWAFNSIAKRLANKIMEANDECHPQEHHRGRI